jgi:hypothetical protein
MTEGPRLSRARRVREVVPMIWPPLCLATSAAVGPCLQVSMTGKHLSRPKRLVTCGRWRRWVPASIGASSKRYTIISKIE